MVQHKLFLVCKLVKNIFSLVDDNQAEDVFPVSRTPENPENELIRVGVQLAEAADGIGSVEKDVIEVNAKAGTRRFSVKNDSQSLLQRQVLKKL